MLKKLLLSGESHPRSAVKAISWRIIGSFDTFVLALLISHDWKIAGSIASVETITKIILYYFHERAWSIIPWGKNKTN